MKEDETEKEREGEGGGGRGEEEGEKRRWKMRGVAVWSENSDEQTTSLDTRQGGRERTRLFPFDTSCFKRGYERKLWSEREKEEGNRKEEKEEEGKKNICHVCSTLTRWR